MMLKGNISGPQFISGDGQVWSFTLHKFGNIKGEVCENVGPEFNPLAEFVYGQPNIYADPSRGTIEDVTISVPEDESVTEQEFKQTKFMQNLQGKDSIMGRTIKVTTTNEDTIVVLGCCVIGHADVPEHVAASLQKT